MYSVSAPANACDTPTGQNKDNKQEQPTTCDLRLVPDTKTSNDFQKTLQSIDAGELAAKILQLHAAADDKEATETRQPKLVEDEDDQFEMPSVLKKNEGAVEQPADDIIAAAPAEESTPGNGSAARGPSFKFLLLSTLLIGVAGGAALALGLPEMLEKEDVAARSVETQLITAEPEVEAGSSAQVTSQDPDLETADVTDPSAITPPATAAQIAKAKDRIQNAFAVGGASAPQPVTLAEPAKNTPINSLAANAVEPANETQSDLGPHPASTAYPVLASTSAPVDLPGNVIAPSAESTGPNTTQAEPVATGAAVDKTTGSDVEANVSAENAAFPNTGKTLASLNMRVTEDKNGQIIAVIPENTQVRFNTCGTWWCGIEYQGKTGFVGQKFLERTPEQGAIE